MLQSLGLVMHAIPRISQRLREICFDDAMTSERSQRGAASALGELHSVITLVGEETLIRQTTDHATHRCRCNRQALRDLVRRGGPGPLADRVDRLEIIFGPRP